MTVEKSSENERLGVAVIVRGGQLFINEISPSGLFANTDLEVNDLVVAINEVIGDAEARSGPRRKDLRKITVIDSGLAAPLEDVSSELRQNACSG